MSHVTMSSEFQAMVDAFGWTLADFQWVTVNALKSAFISFEERLHLIERIVKPGYAAL
jgi:adenosine deaminase